MSLYYWITFILGFPALLFGADYLIKGASSLALKMRIPSALVGFTIIAFGTSAPELLVSIQSALQGEASMAMGNAVGSNIANILLTLGVVSLVRTINLRNTYKVNDIIIFAVASLFIVLSLLFPVYDRIAAIASLCFFGYILYGSWQDIKKQDHHDQDATSTISVYMALIFVIFGFLGLIVGSNWLVRGGQELALLAGISPVVVGLIFFAVGTSLPEVAAAAFAVKNGEHAMAVGNIAGSNIFNGLLVLPVAGLIQPFAVESIIKIRDLPILLISSLVFAYLLFMGRSITKIYGLVFLIAYGFWVYLVAITAGV